MIKEHSSTIGGIAYRTKTFPASEAIKLGARLARLIVAESWQAALAVEEDDLAALAKDPLVILDGLISAARAQSPDEIAALAKDLLVNTTCDDIAGSKQPGPVGTHFDTHFAGRLGHLFEVLMWVARVGFVGP